ncbi:MAG: M23 family metallopeptidase [Clostridia bacterium]|nr:M23 family metallopeptidase [Clostridia bacterium]
MWEKFKKSKFAVKFKDGWSRGGAVIVVFCLVLALAVILSVSVATNRAKKKYGNETTDGVEDITESPSGNNGGNTGDNTGNKPSDGEENSKPTGSGIEEFKLEAPVAGIVSKGHDASIQVWSSTMEDYRVHLGVDVVAEVDTPVYAAADGVVSKVWDDPLMGRCVAIYHGDEVYTYYKNLNAALAENITQGAEVKCGDEIGKVGETAILELADEPHLHLEMTVGGLSVDPRDYFSDKALEAMSRDTSYEQNTNTGK